MSKRVKVKTQADIDNEMLDAAMTAEDWAYWRAVEKDEIAKAEAAKAQAARKPRKR